MEGSSLVVACRSRGSFSGGTLLGGGSGESHCARRMVAVTPLVGPPYATALRPLWWGVRHASRPMKETTCGGSGAST
jgi:hypothetical protein